MASLRGVADPAHLAALRRDYRAAGLSEVGLRRTWEMQLARWFADAAAADLFEPNAVVLATAAVDGRPSARSVLLKAFDERGLTVFTNYTSRKGRELTANPYASLVIPWFELQRQVIAGGPVMAVPADESAAYFRSRPRGAQLSAWASRQSSVIPSRDELVRRRAELEQQFGDDIPVPDFWGGFRLVPETVEFWQGRPDRLHDRLQFRRDGDSWVVERLSP
ncbi:MAG: pyridoxamine 5-phosphate oxidase [Frankiales bacterium]|nr:pyridoxamine 5-phosphate oxidase [Frankiales bacterium]